MNTARLQANPAPPNLIRSLLAGFEASANHLVLILFVIALDAMLWFGPQVRLTRIFGSYVAWLLSEAEQQTPQLIASIQENLVVFQEMVNQFNLLSALRTFPIGIPSLMAGTAPLENPLGLPIAWQPPSLLAAAGIWLLIVLAGLLSGTYFFSVVGQAALQGKIGWLVALKKLPRSFLQVFLLGLFWIAVLLLVTLPVSCLLPFLTMGGGNLGSIFLLFYGGIIIWLIFPLVFSPFGIFVFDDPMWVSILRGIRLVRATFPIALLFILVVLLLGQGLDLVWRLPSITSWLAVVGVVGHAFISTSLLAAAFIFYMDASRYFQQRLDQVRAQADSQ